jgi:hypothetical protein
VVMNTLSLSKTYNQVKIPRNFWGNLTIAEIFLVLLPRVEVRFPELFFSLTAKNDTAYIAPFINLANNTIFIPDHSHYNREMEWGIYDATNGTLMELYDVIIFSEIYIFMIETYLPSFPSNSFYDIQNNYDESFENFG